MSKLNRREWLAALAAPVFAQRASRPPNILWLSAEDMCPDLGCYGDDYAVTPNLDRFAKESVRFSNAYTVYGVCSPSRSSIITAMYPTTIGSCHHRSDAVPPPQVKCFTEYLRSAGYYCTNNAKTDYNFPAPLTAWDENGPKAHWRNRPKGAPFFSVFNLGMTHESQIRVSDREFAKVTERLEPSQRHDPAKAKLPPYYPDTPVVRRDWARYYDLITAMDYRFADFLRMLEEDGVADNTIVFFWGDNGRGLPRGKRWPYNAGVYVPLIVRWPGRKDAGRVEPRMVSLMDLGPTALSMAGIRPPAHMQGRAFLGEHAAPPRQYVYHAKDRMDEMNDTVRAVRDERWLYIKNYFPGRPYAHYNYYGEQMPTLHELRRLHFEGKLKGPELIYVQDDRPPEELYDVQADPHQIHNLAGKPEHAKTLARLRAEHEKWKKETGDLCIAPEPQLIARMRPDGAKKQTATPAIAMRGGEAVLTCSTPGASIAYTLDGGSSPRWLLYTKPVPLPAGAVLRAVACRIGYRDSDVASAQGSAPAPRYRPAGASK